MRVSVKKWGNSASVRIPATVLAAAQLRLNDLVEVREEGGRVVIEPVREPDPTLDELLAGITDDNLHDLVEFGPPVGREAW